MMAKCIPANSYIHLYRIQEKNGDCFAEHLIEIDSFSSEKIIVGEEATITIDIEYITNINARHDMDSIRLSVDGVSQIDVIDINNITRGQVYTGRLSLRITPDEETGPVLYANVWARFNTENGTHSMALARAEIEVETP